MPWAAPVTMATRPVRRATPGFNGSVILVSSCMGGTAFTLLVGQLATVLFLAVRIGHAIEKRAEHAAVEVAGTEQRIAERESQVEISGVHEIRVVMQHMHAPHGVDQRQTIEQWML